MQFIEAFLMPVSVALGVPIDLVVFIALMLVGSAAHYGIYRAVKALTSAADRTQTRWDDVFLYAIFPPIQWVMWVVIGLLSLSLFSSLDGISCLLYTSPSPRDKRQSRMPSSA